MLLILTKDAFTIVLTHHDINAIEFLSKDPDGGNLPAMPYPILNQVVNTLTISGSANTSIPAGRSFFTWIFPSATCFAAVSTRVRISCHAGAVSPTVEYVFANWLIEEIRLLACLIQVK